MSKSFRKFDIGERCVCIYEDDGQPYAAQILSTKDGHYDVHYIGWTSKWDCRIPIGQEGGILFKGTLEEYAEKYEVEVSEWALAHSKIQDDQTSGPVQMDSYGRTYTRRIFVRGDDSSGRRRSRRLTLGGPSTSTAFQESSAKKVKIEKPEDQEREEEVHRYPSRRQSQKIPLVHQIPEVVQDQEEGEDPKQDRRRLRSGKVVVKEEPEDEDREEEEEPRRTYSLRSRTVETEEDAGESEGSDDEDEEEIKKEKAEVQESEDEPTRRSYSLRSRAEVKEEVESEESEGSDQEEEEEEEPRRSYRLRSRTVEPESEKDELEESDEGDEPEEEELEIPEEEQEAPEEPRRSYSLRSRTVEPESEESDDEDKDDEEEPEEDNEPEEEEPTVRCYPLRSQTVEPEDPIEAEESEDEATDYEDAEEEPEEEQDEPEAPESEDEPRRKLPLRPTSNFVASPSRPAKRSLVQEVQVQNPRRRCPFTRPDHQPQCYPDPSKIGSLAGLFNNRSKIRLPGATHIIEHVDRKMLVSIPWCTPIVPAAVPVEGIVRDFMVAQGHIRCHQTTTPAQLAHLAPGIAELVKIFNMNIECTLTDTEKGKFTDVTAGELPSKIYGVIHLMRMMAKLHEWSMPLEIYELIKEESKDFLKFINVNYKKYYQREAEYPIDKHGFESRTGILFLERNI
ncbi:unnamed protein product [Caenorhabditis nigoni]